MIRPKIVPEIDRMDFLPKHFSGSMLRVEMKVYTTMDSICKEYKGGSWDFIELDNGGAYMRWLKDDNGDGLAVSCENYFTGVLSPDAISLVANLYAINAAVWANPDNEGLADKFHALRDYALEHKECTLIMGAID